MNDREIEIARESIEQAKLSQPEDGRTHPKVGVVVAKSSSILGAAFRGELKLGEHAEYTLLERKLSTETLAGCDVYTTLEPCTSRNHPKIPCAHRLVERKVGRVFIGMLDPNLNISGEGQRVLRRAGIATEFYPAILMAEIEELNRDFIADQLSDDRLPPELNDKLLRRLVGRDLDGWYHALNSLYWNRNYNLSESAVFAHLVEVVGGLSTVATEKSKLGVDPQDYLVKAVAWWLALCGKFGVKSVQDLLWDKFPDVCPYCQVAPHHADTCSEDRVPGLGPRWDELERLGRAKKRPARLGQWQRMFFRVYPSDETESFGTPFGRLTEELGELAEAIRVFRAEPGYFLSEAADLFAWLMHVQNIIEAKGGVKAKDRGRALEERFSRAYPDVCRDCRKGSCSCPPILASTIGRAGHEVPTSRATFDQDGRFLTPERVSRLFRPSSP